MTGRKDMEKDKVMNKVRKQPGRASGRAKEEKEGR
jgi:hypothetical protein